MVWDGSLFGYATPQAGAAMPPPMPAPVVNPQPSPGVVTPAPQQQSPQQLAQMVQQLLGNGGGQGADGPNNPAPGSGGNSNGGSWNFGPNQGINLSPWGAGALQGATLLPHGIGTAASLAQMAMRGYNTANANAVRGSLGQGDLDIGQVIGSLLGLNNYGSLQGNQTFVNNDGQTAVTQGGMYDQGFLGGGPLGMFSDMRTAYTPAEKLSHMAMAAAQPKVVTLKDGTQITIGGNGAGGNDYGNGAPGSVSGGQYGNQDTGGMAGPVNRNDSTGMLSRI